MTGQISDEFIFNGKARYKIKGKEIFGNIWFCEDRKNLYIAYFEDSNGFVDVKEDFLENILLKIRSWNNKIKKWN